MIYGIFFGTAPAYLLWFNLVGRLTASTAAMGTLMVPVVGVLASVGYGERSDGPDLVGFTLIFVAALLAPSAAGYHNVELRFSIISLSFGCANGLRQQLA